PSDGMKARVLLVDDDLAMLDWLEAALTRRGFDALKRTTTSDAIAALETEGADVVVTDLAMPRSSGNDLCATVSARFPDAPVLVLTAFGSLASAIEAIRAGAYDFLTKPIEVEALAIAMERALERRALRLEVRRLRETVAPRADFEGLIGSSAAMS